MIQISNEQYKKICALEREFYHGVDAHRYGGGNVYCFQDPFEEIMSIITTAAEKGKYA